MDGKALAVGQHGQTGYCICIVKVQLLHGVLYVKLEMQTLCAATLKPGQTMVYVLHFAESEKLKNSHHTIGSYLELQCATTLSSEEEHSVTTNVLECHFGCFHS